MEWTAFERVSGPLLLTERVDYAAAHVAYVTALSNGVKINGRTPRFKDFVIDWDRLEASEADIAAQIGAALEVAASQPSLHSS